jgi:hypothetical protein
MIVIYKYLFLKPHFSDLDIGELFLSPLRTGLEVGVFGSVHPWFQLRTICIQLVDVYGDSTINLNFDAETRMKLATMHLITAIKLGNQQTKLRENILDICSQSAGTAMNSPVSSELVELFSSMSTSSAMIAASATTAPGLEAAKETPAKGKTVNAAPTSASASITSRDVLSLFATLQRECNFLWQDGFEYDAWSDLHNALKNELEPYKNQLVLNGVPDPGMKANLTVSASSISTCYMPTKAPKGFVYPAKDAESDSDTDTDCGVYSHLQLYILLGPRQSQLSLATGTSGKAVDPKAAKQPAASKEKSSATLSTESTIGEPVLTKTVLFRPHVSLLLRSLHEIRDHLLEAIAKDWDDMKANCGQRLGRVLCQLLGLLKLGVLPQQKRDSGGEKGSDGVLLDDDSMDPTFELEPPSAARSFALLKIGGFSGSSAVASTPINCFIPVHEECLGKLITLLSFPKDVDSILDNDVCTLYRYALGYYDV